VSAGERSGVRDRISEGLTRERLALELRRARVPFVLWLALLAGALVALALLLTRLHLPAPWASTYHFKVAAADVTGVQPGNEVRIAGVEVGHVTGINLKNGRPVLAVAIDPKNGPIYRDARVQIRPNTPLQDMYLDIVSRGSRPAGPVPADGELEASQTESPVQFGQVIDIFDASVRPRVTATIDALGQGLGDHGAQLRQALSQLAPFLKVAQRLARETAIRQLQTERLVHNFALLNGELANRSGQLSGLVRDGAITMMRLASVERPLGQLIDELPPTLRVMPPAFAAVNAAAAQLDPAAQSLLPVADALAPAMGALERLSPTATTALGALDRALPGLANLLADTRPLATGLGRSFARMRPQSPQLDRVTAAIHPCETAIQKFFQWTLSVSKMSGLHGAMGRGVSLFGPQSVAGLVSPTVNANQGLLSVAPTCSGVPPGP
jgi:virulence factor Mce-like protein